jgi:hypothetical protein
MRGSGCWAVTAFGLSLASTPACDAQTASNLAALIGLAPVAALPNSPRGRAALAANLRVTGGIQTGTLRQPLLMSFTDQQQQALQDAFITGGNLAELSDGLGSTLGPIYRAHADYTAPRTFTNLSPNVAALIAYAGETEELDSGTAKYFFANGNLDKKAPASPEATKIISDEHGVTDVFGRAYDRPAGSPGADQYGDSRPFQTEPAVKRFTGTDYFAQMTSNVAYLRGPAQNLTNSPSFPSGHTAYGYTGALILALLVPSRYEQEMTRAAEYGNDRIIIGAHYAMDVIGGRTLALYDMAHLLANDPDYVGKPREHAKAIPDFRAALTSARVDTVHVLQSGCRRPLAECAASDSGRFKDQAGNQALVAATLTYGLPTVHPENAGRREDVGQLAPEAGNLLTAAFPWLTLAEADRILTETESPGGGFLDNGTGFGVYSRLNLAAAAEKAATSHAVSDNQGQPS